MSDFDSNEGKDLLYIFFGILLSVLVCYCLFSGWNEPYSEAIIQLTDGEIVRGVPAEVNRGSNRVTVTIDGVQYIVAPKT